MPDRETEVGEVGALLATVNVPVKLPAAEGEKTIWTTMLAPGGIELRTGLLSEKFDPPEVMLALLMVRVALPVLVTSIICEDELPTVTCPKETEAGFVRMAGPGPGLLPAPPIAHADMNRVVAMQAPSKTRRERQGKRLIT